MVASVEFISIVNMVDIAKQCREMLREKKGKITQECLACAEDICTQLDRLTQKEVAGTLIKSDIEIAGEYRQEIQELLKQGVEDKNESIKPIASSRAKFDLIDNSKVPTFEKPTSESDQSREDLIKNEFDELWSIYFANGNVLTNITELVKRLKIEAQNNVDGKIAKIERELAAPENTSLRAEKKTKTYEQRKAEIYEDFYNTPITPVKLREIGGINNLTRWIKEQLLLEGYVETKTKAKIQSVPTQQKTDTSKTHIQLENYQEGGRPLGLVRSDAYEGGQKPGLLISFIEKFRTRFVNTSKLSVESQEDSKPTVTENLETNTFKVTLLKEIRECLVLTRNQDSKQNLALLYYRLSKINSKDEILKVNSEFKKYQLQLKIENSVETSSGDKDRLNLVKFLNLLQSADSTTNVAKLEQKFNKYLDVQKRREQELASNKNALEARIMLSAKSETNPESLEKLNDLVNSLSENTSTEQISTIIKGYKEYLEFKRKVDVDLANYKEDYVVFANNKKEHLLQAAEFLQLQFTGRLDVLLDKLIQCKTKTEADTIYLMIQELDSKIIQTELFSNSQM
jgi:hypothetical protein